MAANYTVPWNDSTVYVSIISNTGARNDTAISQTNSFSNFAVCSNGYIWTYFAIGTNSWWRVNINISALVVRMSIDVIVVKIWTLCLDVISRFSDIVPKVVFNGKRIKLTFLGQSRIDLSLNHAESLGNTVKDWSIQDIDACINVVSNKLFWFLYKSLYSTSFLIM